MAIYGCMGPYMAVYDHIRPYMAIGRIWPDGAVHSHIRPYMAMHQWLHSSWMHEQKKGVQKHMFWLAIFVFFVFAYWDVFLLFVYGAKLMVV